MSHLRAAHGHHGPAQAATVRHRHHSKCKIVVTRQMSAKIRGHINVRGYVVMVAAIIIKMAAGSSEEFSFYSGVVTVIGSMRKA